MTVKITRLALTSGDPAGIGPDLCLALAQQSQSSEIITLADPDLLRERAQQLGLSIQLVAFDPQKAPAKNSAKVIKILPIPLAETVKVGQLNQANASYVLKTLKVAAQGCLEHRFDAMVTAPIHKGIINDAGIPFTGHTEFLAKYTHAKHPVMLLVADQLRVALATTHLPLSAVSQQITPNLLKRVLRILEHDLKHKFGLKQPRILVCGLNPHAGEDGHLGHEELDIIIPTLEILRRQGFNLVGPLPADTLFTPRYLDNADAVLAMYHDQGLPVLKHVGFGRAVNITLGLPIIRTSVDHGTALSLAGTGKASLGSLLAAIAQAKLMVERGTNV